jgi:hypothetical protein
VLGGHVQGRDAGRVAGVRVRALGQEEFDKVLAPACGQAEGRNCAARGRLAVNVGPLGDRQFNDGAVAAVHGNGQGRKAAPEHVRVRALAEAAFDLAQVALLPRAEERRPVLAGPGSRLRPERPRLRPQEPGRRAPSGQRAPGANRSDLIMPQV